MFLVAGSSQAHESPSPFLLPPRERVLESPFLDGRV